jgi:glutaconyl-CoA/methylmalonyl-CoA decarboxylase subunit gamma
VKFKLQVDGKEYAITAAADGTVTIDDETFAIKPGAVTGDKRTIQVGEKNYEIWVVESTEDVGCFTLEVAGERVPLTASDLVRESGPVTTATSAAAAGAAAASAAAAAGGAITPASEAQDGLFAPVPGKIVDVFVKAGDAVDEGTPLVVLEAMKMENELRAPKKGKVTVVAVQKGDTAQRGQLLVGIE